LFFDDPIPASKIRTLLYGVAPRDAKLKDGSLADPESNAGIEIFPKLDRHAEPVTVGSVGCQTWLPWWHGAKDGGNLFYEIRDGEVVPFVPDYFETHSEEEIDAAIARLPKKAKSSQKNTFKIKASASSAEWTADGRPTTNYLINRALAHAGKGRNDNGKWLAIQIRDNGYSQAEAEQVMQEYVQLVSQQGHPYKLSEAMATVRSIYKKPAREPWSSFRSIGRAEYQTNGQKTHQATSEDPEEEPQQPEPWDDPIPFDTRPDVPCFPTKILPPWMAEFTSALATASQTPTDLAGMLAIAHVGATAAEKFRVEIRDGWVEPVNIYAVCALLSGERKSCVFRETMGPAFEHERNLQEEMKPIIAEAQTEHGILEARPKHLSGRYAKEIDANNRNELRQEIKDATRELTLHEVPVEPRVVCEDISPEKLEQMLVAQDRRMLLAGPEGTAVEIAKGRYGDVPNFDVFLKGHVGDPLRSDRISRGSQACDSPALSIALAVKPDVISGLANEATMLTRGFLARFLYSLPINLVGRREIAAAAVPAKVASTYRKNMLALWRAKSDVDSQGKPVPRLLRFSPAADATMRDFERWLEPQLGDEGLLSQMGGWANKLSGAIGRIAGILHVASHAGSTVPLAISSDTVLSAITLGKDYLLPHAMGAFGVMGDSAWPTCSWPLSHWPGSGTSR
jgi:hypothetical protein